MKFACKSVTGGWQTLVSFSDAPEIEFLIGPCFHSATELWNWQKTNLIKEL